jgi:hypothetical protein
VRRWCSASSVRIFSAACAIASGWLNGTSRPVSPSTSEQPPTSVLTLGTPQLIASSIDRPKLSVSDADRNRSACGSRSCTFSCMPRCSTLPRQPRSLATASVWSRSGPSPMSTRRAGICFWIAANARTTSAVRFTGRKFDACTSTRSSSVRSRHGLRAPGLKRSTSTKLCTTSTSLRTPNTSCVSSAR